MKLAGMDATMGPHGRNLEREVKLATDPDFEMPELDMNDGFLTRLPHQELNTTYFDTPDFRLLARGITLRFRQGETRHLGVWTLKIPARNMDGPIIERTELTWPGELQALPSEAIAATRGLVRRSALEKVAELSTIRRRLIFHDAAGTALGEMDDDTVTIVSGSRDGLRFRQIELEFGPGEDD